MKWNVTSIPADRQAPSRLAHSAPSPACPSPPAHLAWTVGGCSVAMCKTQEVMWSVLWDVLWDHERSSETKWDHVRMTWLKGYCDVRSCNIMWYHVRSCEIMWDHVRSWPLTLLTPTHLQEVIRYHMTQSLWLRMDVTWDHVTQRLKGYVRSCEVMWGHCSQCTCTTANMYM